MCVYEIVRIGCHEIQLNRKIYYWSRIEPGIIFNSDSEKKIRRESAYNGIIEFSDVFLLF